MICPAKLSTAPHASSWMPEGSRERGGGGGEGGEEGGGGGSSFAFFPSSSADLRGGVHPAIVKSVRGSGVSGVSVSGVSGLSSVPFARPSASEAGVGRCAESCSSEPSRWGDKINSLLRQYLYVCTSKAADAPSVVAERRLAAASAAVFVLLYE